MSQCDHFKSVYRRYIETLGPLRPIDHDEDRWISYGLSYIALRDCVRLGHGGDFSYVYAACWNAHTRHLKDFEDEHSAACLTEDDLAYEPDWAATDIRLDVAAALEGLEPEAADLVWRHAALGESFAELGRQTEGSPDRSTLKRRFDRCLPSLRERLCDYRAALAG